MGIGTTRSAAKLCRWPIRHSLLKPLGQADFCLLMLDMASIRIKTKKEGNKENANGIPCGGIPYSANGGGHRARVTSWTEGVEGMGIGVLRGPPSLWAVLRPLACPLWDRRKVEGLGRGSRETRGTWVWGIPNSPFCLFPQSSRSEVDSFLFQKAVSSFLLGCSSTMFLGVPSRPGTLLFWYPQPSKRSSLPL